MFNNKEGLVDSLLRADTTGLFDRDFAEYLADCIIKDGVIFPPCKVGDTVYYITGIHNSLVGSAKVEEIYYNGYGFAYGVCTNDSVRFDIQEKEIYYTPEEAEKVLERNKSNA